MFGINYQLIVYMVVVLIIILCSRTKWTSISLGGVTHRIVQVDSRLAQGFLVQCHLRCSLDGNHVTILRTDRILTWTNQEGSSCRLSQAATLAVCPSTSCRYPGPG